MAIVIGSITGSHGVSIGNDEDDDQEIVVGSITDSTGIVIGNK